MRFFQFALEMLAPFGRDLAEHRDAALELARRHHLDVDIVLLQDAIEIRHLGDDADAADHGERRGDQPVGDHRHHIAAARRHLIDGNRQLDPRRA